MRLQPCEPPQAGEQFIFLTADGTEVRVGRPAPGGAGANGRRVSLHIGHPADGEGRASETLTPGEARQLAAALLQQAAAAEDGHADGAVGQLAVSYLGGESYAAATRAHVLLTDQPATAGGADSAASRNGP